MLKPANISNTIKDSISVNEVKALLHSIHKKVENVEQCATTTNQLIQMTHDNIGEQKQFYIQQMKDVLQSRKEESEILNLIRETNNAFLDKTYPVAPFIKGPKYFDLLFRPFQLGLY